jgi:hypothetical protein
LSILPFQPDRIVPRKASIVAKSSMSTRIHWPSPLMNQSP